jgi:hypothetical protein
MRKIPPYAYIKRYYGVDPKVGQTINHHITNKVGVIKRPTGDPHYLRVDFDDGRGAVNVHPTECDYLATSPAV